MICVLPIPAFKDNYIWLLTDSNKQFGVLVDPGDAEPAIAYLEQEHIHLAAVLITHHHWDHSGGIIVLSQKYHVPIYGSAVEKTDGVTHFVQENDTIILPKFNVNMEVLSIPGHTRGHVAYYGQGMLFCGDTLFSSGCGRLFEGTADQMVHSLSQLSALPDETKVYCGHEYTLANLKFAQTVEPKNPDIQQYIKKAEQLQNTLPSTIGLEKQVNPFLRCHVTDVITAAEKFAGHKLTSEVEVFAALREWKNTF